MTVIGRTGLVKQQGESTNLAELLTREVRVEGDFDTLARTYHQGAAYDGLNYIRSVQIQGDENGRAIATLQIVYVTGSSTEGIYFNTTWEVDIREVSKSLKTHPHITPNDLGIIRLWEATPEAKRVQYASDGTPSFFYYDSDGTPTVEEPPLVPVTSGYEGAIDYMKAVIAGIENFNVYLPVVRRVRQYLGKPPASKVGVFSAPVGFSLSGFSSSDFFKSADKSSKNADGSWTRTEEWTYTNDRSHDWIYTNT